MENTWHNVTRCSCVIIRKQSAGYGLNLFATVSFSQTIVEGMGSIILKGNATLKGIVL